MLSFTGVPKYRLTLSGIADRRSAFSAGHVFATITPPWLKPSDPPPLSPSIFGWLTALTFAGLVGAALRWPEWGVVFMVPLGMAMSAVSFLVSYYFNALVDSRQRATVLSFKGLAINLGYGFVSLAFAGALRALRGHGPEETFGRTLPWLPVWLGCTLVLLAAGFWRWRFQLSRPVTW